MTTRLWTMTSCWSSSSIQWRWLRQLHPSHYPLAVQWEASPAPCLDGGTLLKMVKKVIQIGHQRCNCVNNLGFLWESPPCFCYSKHAHPSTVFGCTHSGWWGLWKRLSRHDHAQDGVCWLHGWRQRHMQCESPRTEPTDVDLFGSFTLLFCVSGWLWQPSGVCWRSARPGVMGSRLRSAQLPWSLC